MGENVKTVLIFLDMKKETKNAKYKMPNKIRVRKGQINDIVVNERRPNK